MRREWLSVSDEQCFNLMAVPSGEIKPFSHYKTRLLSWRQTVDLTWPFYRRIVTELLSKLQHENHHHNNGCSPSRIFL